jgi:hypothetical protein
VCLIFPARLEYCLEKGGASIMHDLYRPGERDAMEDFESTPRNHASCAPEEDRTIFDDYLRGRPRSCLSERISRIARRSR